MTDKEIIRISKFLSLIMRHQPDRVDLTLDGAGWVGVAELLEAVNRNGVSLTMDQLKQVVVTNDKKRFEFSQDGQRIRASQGHSVEVDLQYEPQTPPEFAPNPDSDTGVSVRNTRLISFQMINVWSQ